MFFTILSTVEVNEDVVFLTELYDRYYPIMKKKAYEILQDYDIVDDMIQESFVRLISKAALLRSLDLHKQVSYLVHTVHNTSINHAKQRKRHLNHTSSGITADSIEQIADKQPSIEEMYSLKEDYTEIAKILSELSERDQTLLYNKYILEWSDHKLAASMDVQAVNIRSYLTRARRRAMKLLLKEWRKWSMKKHLHKKK